MRTTIETHGIFKKYLKGTALADDIAPWIEAGCVRRRRGTTDDMVVLLFEVEAGEDEGLLLDILEEHGIGFEDSLPQEERA